MDRRTFSKQYKLQTIKQVTEQGNRITDVSRALGITEEHYIVGYENTTNSEKKQLEQEYKILKKHQTFLKGRQKKK